MVVFSGDTVLLPLVLPSATSMHRAAFCDDQVRVELWPGEIMLGLALMLTLRSSRLSPYLGSTTTVTLLEAVSPALFLQVML